MSGKEPDGKQPRTGYPGSGLPTLAPEPTPRPPGSGAQKPLAPVRLAGAPPPARHDPGPTRVDPKPPAKPPPCGPGEGPKKGPKP